MHAPCCRQPNSNRPALTARFVPCHMSTNRIESFEALQNIISNPSKPLAQVCQAIDECISCNWDNLRGFFELCFPLLVKNLFGYDGPSWLSAVAQVSASSDGDQACF